MGEWSERNGAAESPRKAADNRDAAIQPAAEGLSFAQARRVGRQRALQPDPRRARGRGRSNQPYPRALAALKSKRAVEPLQLTLPQAHGLFAIEVATALRAIAKDKSGFGAIAEALRNGAVEERRRAIEVFAAYPSADAKSALTAAASQDPDPALQKYAQEALAKLPS
jgi:hypothetical protein